MTVPALAARLEELTHALKLSWDDQTSAERDSLGTVASRGQCAVSALIIQDEFGGDLMRAEVAGVSHYWNQLPDGSEVDVTRDQFDSWYPVGVAVRDRAYVLSFPDTAARYTILRHRVNEQLKLRS